MCEINTKHVNYYSPVQHDDDDIPPCEKRHKSSSRVTARILGRKYALTATSYKYLEIGISVGSAPTVEIIIANNCNDQLIISIETWTKLMGQRIDIQRLLQADKRSSSSLSIQDLVLEFFTIKNSKIVKLTLSDKSLYMKPITMNTLFTYEECIDHMYKWLFENTYLVSIKFQSFVNVLREKNITEMHHAVKAIRESRNYDCDSLIDCELLACALKDIMYEATNK